RRRPWRSRCLGTPRTTAGRSKTPRRRPRRHCGISMWRMSQGLYRHFCGRNTMSSRRGSASRDSAETQVRAEVTLEGGLQEISTGLASFDPLLNAFARHGRFGLNLSAKGDLDVDVHHTIEDVGIVLGRAFSQALGDRRGIERMGSAYVPMDETLVRASF